MVLRKILLFLGVVLISPALSAARYPNAVVKDFSFQGKEAQEIAILLGMDPLLESQKKLRLHKGNEWAVYLRDTPHPDSTSHQVERPRYNTIKYTPATMTLSLQGDWLDTTTGSSPQQPRFTFSSPALAESDFSAEGWGPLIRHVISPKQKIFGKVLFEKRIQGSGTAEFKLLIYQATLAEGQWGYQIEIGAQ